MLLTLLSALGVLFLTAIAFALGFRARPELDAATAMDEAARIPRFRPAEACLAADGRAALVRGADGRIALITLPGDRPVARLLPAGAAARQVPGGLVLDLGEPFLRRVGFSCAATPDWLATAA